MSKKLNIRRARSRRFRNVEHAPVFTAAEIFERLEAVEDFVDAAIIHAANEALSDCRHMTAH